ncbi:hypothetical protein [Sphingobacterium detergens]
MLRLIFTLGCAIHFCMASVYNLRIIFKLPDHLPDIFEYAYLYQDLAGLSGGYTFYGPSVGMQVQLEYIQYQEGNETLLSEPRIQSTTGMLRLNSYLQLGSSFVDSSQSYLQDQVRASISNLTGSLPDIEAADSISCRLITKYIPALGQKSEQLLSSKYIILFEHIKN